MFSLNSGWSQYLLLSNPGDAANILHRQVYLGREAGHLHNLHQRQLLHDICFFFSVRPFALIRCIVIYSAQSWQIIYRCEFISLHGSIDNVKQMCVTIGWANHCLCVVAKNDYNYKCFIRKKNEANNSSICFNYLPYFSTVYGIKYLWKIMNNCVALRLFACTPSMIRLIVSMWEFVDWFHQKCFYFLKNFPHFASDGIELQGFLNISTNRSNRRASLVLLNP